MSIVIILERQLDILKRFGRKLCHSSKNLTWWCCPRNINCSIGLPFSAIQCINNFMMLKKVAAHSRYTCITQFSQYNYGRLMYRIIVYKKCFLTWQLCIIVSLQENTVTGKGRKSPSKCWVRCRNGSPSILQTVVVCSVCGTAQTERWPWNTVRSTVRAVETPCKQPSKQEAPFETPPIKRYFFCLPFYKHYIISY